MTKPAAIALLVLCGSPARAAVGSWQALVNVPSPAPYNGNPTGYGEMLLLTDGTVMVKLQSNITTRATNLWARLTPDAGGSYVSGSWSRIASMNYPRLFFGSVVMKDGRVFVSGGEYPSTVVGGVEMPGPQSPTIEIYDPLADSWTMVGGWTHGNIADSTVKLLADGRVLVLEGETIASDGGYIYDPDPASAHPWTAIAAKIGGDWNDEESVVTLPEGTFLSVDNAVNNLNSPPPQHAQKYLPASNTWIDAGMTNLDLVNPGSVGPFGREIGPGLLLYDGRAFFIGTLITSGVAAKTALYTPGVNATQTGSWAAGPDLEGGATPLYSNDEPGAVMPNGHVLFVADSESNSNSMLEYDPVAASLTTAPYPGLVIGSSHYNMLVLPTGQVLLSTKTQNLYVYNPSFGVNEPNPAWRPTITSIVASGNGTYLLSGTQLNGLTEGAYEGDDVQMATNYPLVRLADGAGHVYYARTFGFSTMALATGNAPVSASFSVGGIPTGDYSLVVVANGIASAATPFVIAGASDGGADDGGASQSDASMMMMSDASMMTSDASMMVMTSDASMMSTSDAAAIPDGSIEGDGSRVRASGKSGCACDLGASSPNFPWSAIVVVAWVAAQLARRRLRATQLFA